MPTTTANLALLKPEVGGDAAAWGGYLNTTIDMIDGIFTSASSTSISAVIKDTTKFVNATTTTKAILFSLSGINTTTPRTITWQDADITVAGVASTVSIIAANSFAGVSSTSFTGIASTVNHLMLMFEMTTGTTNADIYMRTYGAAGALATATTDYFGMGELISSAASTPSVSSLTSSLVNLAVGVATGTYGVSGTMSAQNIQAATRTKFINSSQYIATSAAVILINGIGVRNEADRITGVLIGVTTGVMTGKATLLGAG